MVQIKRLACKVSDVMTLESLQNHKLCFRVQLQSYQPANVNLS
jgi:hypothetical protein